MSSLNRRDFLQYSVTGVLTATTFSSATVDLNRTPQTFPAAACPRSLGTTGLTCTRLGIGTGTRAWNKNSAQIRRGRDVFLKTLVHAYELGIRYYDLADMYGSHDYLCNAMSAANMQREDMFILTKTVAKTGAELEDALKRMLTELHTHYLDVVLLHCLTSGDWPQEMKECMDILDKAKESGIIRAKGVSCHHLQALQAAASNPWTDIILARINPFGTHMDGTQQEIVEVLTSAKANGKGVIGMKILGEGKHAKEKEECITFAMNLECIDAFTIGFLSPEELEEIVQLMEKVKVT